MKTLKEQSLKVFLYKEEKQSIFRCFDLKGYLLMLFMMTLSIMLRASNLLPGLHSYAA